MEEISFEELRKVHLEEKHSPLLSPLPENFFDAYLEHLDKFYSELKGGFSIEGAKTYENSRKVFLDLVRLRCQKITLLAFKQTRVGSISSDGLTRQEKELYLSMLRSFTEYEKALAEFKQVAVPLVEKVEKSVEVEVLVDVPTFISPTGKAIGPLYAGKVVEVDEATAAILVEKNACKVI